MAKKGEPRPPDDELSARLREGARRRKPWALTRAIVLAIVVIVPVAAFFLFFEPSGPEIPLVGLAFDALVPESAEAELIAQVLAFDPENPAPRLGGRTIIFEITGQEGADVKRMAATTDAQGVARERIMPLAGTADVVLRWPHGRIADQARLFRLSAKTPLVLVDVATALTTAPQEQWRQETVLDIAASADAAAVLRTLAGKEFAVVYLATASPDVVVQRKVRGWMDSRFGEGFPLGPVLGRASYGADENSVFAAIRKAFSGSIHVVVGDLARAKQAADFRITPIVLKAADVPPEMNAVNDWFGVAEYFEKLVKE